MYGWILRHVPSQIFAAGFAEEIQIIWFLSPLHCWGIWWTASDTVHDLSEATAWSLSLATEEKSQFYNRVEKLSRPQQDFWVPLLFLSLGPGMHTQGHPFHTAARHLTAPKPGGGVGREKCWDLASLYVLGSTLEFTQIIIFNLHEEPYQVGTFFLFSLESWCRRNSLGLGVGQTYPVIYVNLTRALCQISLSLSFTHLWNGNINAALLRVMLKINWEIICKVPSVVSSMLVLIISSFQSGHKYLLLLAPLTPLPSPLGKSHS